MKKLLLIIFILVLITLTAYYFWPEKRFPANTKITKIIALKSKREMMVYHNEKLLKTYSISLGRYPVGKKEIEGGEKTPEGRYFINSKNPQWMHRSDK